MKEGAHLSNPLLLPPLALELGLLWFRKHGCEY
jgi:hypothetical protein